MDEDGVGASDGGADAEGDEGLLCDDLEGADATDGAGDAGGEVGSGGKQGDGQDVGEGGVEVGTDVEGVGDEEVDRAFAEPDGEGEQDERKVLAGRAEDAEGGDEGSEEAQGRGAKLGWQQAKEALDGVGEGRPDGEEGEEDEEATEDCAYGDGQQDGGGVGDAGGAVECAEEQEPRGGDGDYGDEGEAVEDALDGDAAEGGAGAEVLLAGEVVGADELAETQGEQVVGGVADDDDGVEAVNREAAQRREEVLPAIGAEVDADEVEGDGGNEIEVVGLSEQSFQLAGLELAEEEEKQGRADDDAQAEVPSGGY